jgi:hypothetical protein
MKRFSTILAILLLLCAWMLSCEEEITEPRDEECDLFLIDFGQVPYGTFKDTCATLRALRLKSGDGHFMDTIVIDCSDFHFVDTLSGQTFDTLVYDLTYPGDTTFCIRFEPQEPLPALCTVDRGVLCGELNLTGTGVLTGYYYAVEDAGTKANLYDVNIVPEFTAAVACGDSGTVLAKYGSDPWTEPCDRLTTSPLLDMEIDINVMLTMFVGGGGESNGLIFIECDPGPEVEGIDYFTAALVLEGGRYMWIVGRGIESPDGFNGIHFGLSGEDSFTLYDEASEISDIDGAVASDVWAVLSQPSYNLYHFDGESWELRTEGWMTESLHGVWVHESGEAFAVGTNGVIYHYTGAVWEDQSIEAERGTLYAVWGFSPEDVYAVGEGTAVYHFDGASWGAVPRQPDIDATLYGIHGVDLAGGGKALYVVGERGTIIGYAPELFLGDGGGIPLLRGAGSPARKPFTKMTASGSLFPSP